MLVFANNVHIIMFEFPLFLFSFCGGEYLSFLYEKMLPTFSSSEKNNFFLTMSNKI